MMKKETVDDSSAFSVADGRGNQNSEFFFFWKSRTSPNVSTPVDASFRTPENYLGMRIEKTIENKDEYVSDSVSDFGAWHEAIARWDTRPFDSDITDR